MVPADSQQIPRARCYLGIHHARPCVFSYRTLTVYGRPFQATSPNTRFSDSRFHRQMEEDEPHNTTHTTPYPVSHAHGLASSAFARHYSRNHILFSLPMGTEMFHFPTFPPHPPIHSEVGNTTSLVLGFPHSDTLGSQLV